MEKDALKVEEQKQPVSKEMTKEERLARERILGKYAYDVDEIVETKTGELEIHYKAAPSNQTGLNGLEGNMNALRVKEVEQARRMESKKEHEKKVEKEKQLLEQQRLKKEKEKRRTQKQEKRRM